MRSRIFLLALVCVVGSLAVPLAAHAGIPFFGPIIPPGETSTCALGWGAVINVVNRIIQLLLTLAIVFVAPIMIAYAGFLYVVNPVNPSGKQKAKDILLHTIVGIVIALASWLIIAAVMAVLYNPATPIAGGTLGVWTDIIGSQGLPACLPAPTVSTPPPPPGIIPGPPPPPPPTDLRGFVIGPECGDSNTQNVYTLVAAGVRGSSSGSCCVQSNRSCTSLSGMKEATMSQIKNIQNICGAVTVTGGTEAGHATLLGVDHSSGVKVDLATNIDNCITPRTNAAGTRSDGATLRADSCGNIYAREGNHWDITVLRVCSL